MCFPIIIPNTINSSIADNNGPSVNTLENYIHYSKEEFHKIFIKNLEPYGIISGVKLAEMYWDFDNLNEKQKQKVIEVVEGKEEKSILEMIKSIFK
jgi:hypothetical protein